MARGNCSGCDTKLTEDNVYSRARQSKVYCIECDRAKARDRMRKLRNGGSTPADQARSRALAKLARKYPEEFMRLYGVEIETIKSDLLN